jgi:hypothetical protein
VNIFGLAANDQSNGFESDNENNAATGHSALPRTKARVSNMTLIGPYADSASAANGNLTKWQHEALLRRSTEFSIYNSVLVGWPFGPQVRDTATQRAAVDNRLEIRNTSVGASQGTASILTQTVTTTPTPVITFDPLTWFNAGGKNNRGSTPRQWGPGSSINFTAAAFNLNATNDPVPGAGTELATAGSALDGRLAGDPFFTATTYRGAFDPAVPMSSQWTAGWTNFDPQTTLYTDVKEIAGEVPTEFTLAQNYPNPFNPSTVVRFSVPTNGRVLLKVYNISGQEVATLVDGEMTAGNYEAEFNASKFASGTYVYRLTSNGATQARMMMLLK